MVRRCGAVLAAALLAVSGLQGCVSKTPPGPDQQRAGLTSEGEDANMPENDRNTSGLLLTTHFAIVDGPAGQTLVLDYRVDNHGTADVYLLNRIPRALPRFTVDPDTIYVHFADGTVHLEKAIAAVPPGRQPYELVAPFVSPVRAGESFSEKVRLTLPLQEYREYTAVPDRSGGSVEVYHRVDFTLGYMVKLPGTTEREAEVQGVKVLLFTNPPGTLSQAGKLRSPVAMLPIPILR